MVDAIAPSSRTEHDERAEDDLRARPAAEKAERERHFVEVSDCLAASAIHSQPLRLAQEAFAPAPPRPSAPSFRADELGAMQSMYDELARLGDKQGCRPADTPASLAERLLALREREARSPFPNSPTERQELEMELARLGDTSGCRPGETLDTVRARVDALRAEKRAEAVERHERTVFATEEGTGTPSQLRAHDVVGRVEAANPGSGTGAWLAGILAAQGAPLRDIRAAGELGNAVEGLAGGAAHVVEIEREREAPPIEREVAGERPKAETSPRETKGPERSRTDGPRAEPARAAPATKIRAKYVNDGERVEHARLSDLERAEIDVLLRERDAARGKLEELQKRAAPAREINQARNTVGVISQQLGEVAASASVRAAFPGPPEPQKLWPPEGVTARSGEFDQVWRVEKNGRPAIAVVEAKGGRGKLGTRQVDGMMVQQGARAYFDAIIREMALKEASFDVAALIASTPSSDLLYLKASTSISERITDGGRLSSASTTTLREFAIQGETR